MPTGTNGFLDGIPLVLGRLWRELGASAARVRHGPTGQRGGDAAGHVRRHLFVLL